jgi:hypothetical protein
MKVTSYLVKKLLKKGWQWAKTSGKGRWLLPPPGDERHTWAAMWLPYGKYGRVPHWAYDEYEKGRNHESQN